MASTDREIGASNRENSETGNRALEEGQDPAREGEMCRGTFGGVSVTHETGRCAITAKHCAQYADGKLLASAI